VCERASVRLPRTLDSVGQARTFVTQTLIPRIAPTSADILDATTVSVSELVTNALRYGEGEVTVELVVHRDTVDLTVCDAGRGEPRPRQPGPSAESGRGLQLVEAFSSSWGTRPLQNGKAVWCRVDLAPSVGCVHCDDTVELRPPDASG
jgi:anti-sigma regulatory factor (Ser/Thr protein kinase)